MKKVFYIIIYILLSNFIYGQGKIPMQNKSFTGALEFLPKGKLAAGYSRVKSPFPMGVDPLVDPEKWYVEGDQQMRGMIGDAVLFLEWWTTTPTPAERYKFDWTSSGYFVVVYKNEKGMNVNQRVDRYKLEKYPNLLKRFDNITPIEVDFEFTFFGGDIPDKEYYAFREKYNLNSDLGSLGYAVNATRKLNADFILYKANRNRQEWTSPGPFLQGWDGFLTFPEEDNDKKSRLIELFKLGETLVMVNFKMTTLKWRMSDFVYIAKKFNDYESGKEKPSVFDEVEKGEKENKAGGSFWDDTDIVDSETESFYDQQAKKYGVRTLKGKILVSGKYNQIIKSGKYYIARNDNTAYLLNNMGGLLKTKTYSNISSINSDLTVTFNYKSDDVENTPYSINYGESESLVPGKEGAFKHYSVYDRRGMSLIMSNANEVDKRTEEQKKRDEENREKFRAQKIREAELRFESLGYKKR